MGCRHRIGAIGTIERPIIGALIFFALRETLADLGTAYLLVLGVVAIGIILKAPNKVWGLKQDQYGLQLFPVSHHVEKE